MTEEFDEEEGFDSWKEMVGLPREFPLLEPIIDPYVPIAPGARGSSTTLDPRLSLTGRQQGLVQAILKSMGNPLLAVQVALGHGCTTLSRLIYASSEIASVGQMVIPVRIAIEDRLLIDGLTPPRASIGDLKGASRRKARADRTTLAEQVFAELLHEDAMVIVNDAIRYGILRSLATQPWELAMGKPHYASLIGAVRSDPKSLSDQRQKLARTFANGTVRAGAVAAVAPDLPVSDAAALIRALKSKDRRAVRLSLQFDLSPSVWGRYHDPKEGEILLDPYVAVLRGFVQAFKNLDQINSNAEPPTLPSLMDQMIFISPEGLGIFRGEWTQEPELIEWDPLAPGNVFAILGHHFPPQHAGPGVRPTDRLSAIMSPNTFDHVDETVGLNTAMERLRASLLAELDDPRTTPYHVKGDIPVAPTELSAEHARIQTRLDRIEGLLEGLLGLDRIKEAGDGD